MCSQSAPVILLDGNSAVYLLSRNYIEGVRYPIWFDLPPARCHGLGFQTLLVVGPHCKNKVAIIAMGMEVREKSWFKNRTLYTE